MSAYEYSGSIVPTGWGGSTYLNPAVRTYDDLTKRVKMQLGWPIMSVEVLDCGIYDNINIAIEMYSRYAGFTEEYLVFDSNAYTRGVGIRMDQVISYLSSTYKAGSAAVSGRFWDQDNGVMDELQQRGDYRKVAGVFSFDSVNNSGVDVLFSLDYIFAAQTYFNYMQDFGGFDLVTWQVLKEWMELREKMFATKIHYMFDNRTQLLRLLPEPGANFTNRYIGIIGAYVEKPIRDLLPEQWVQKYTLALTKIMLGNVRGKFGGSINLLGGGTINYNDILSQGIAEKDKLEADLMEKPGEANPVSFFVG
jgi:hypothetical protein